MQKRRISILKFIKVRMSIIIFLIFAVVFSMGTLAFKALQDDYASQQLINIFGRQRMYTQMMAKDASRLYVLRDALQKDDGSSGDELKRKIEDTKKELKESREQFDSTYQSIKIGRLYAGGTTIEFASYLDKLRPVIDDTDMIWSKFGKYIDEILDDEKIEKRGYLSYINENNIQLLNNSDDITNILVEISKGRRNNSILLSAALGLIAAFSISILLLNINRYLILPLNELYKGLSEVGLSSFTEAVTKPTNKELEPVIIEVNEMFMKFNNLIELIENINQTKSFSEIMEYIYLTFSTFIPYNHIGIALFEDNGEYIKASYVISDKEIKEHTEKFVGYKERIKNTSLSKIIETGEPRVINDLVEYTNGKSLKEYNTLLIDMGIRSSITLPLKINNRPVGVIFFSSLRSNVYTPVHEKFLKTIANSIAISLEKNIFANDLLYSSILALAKLADSRDTDTGEHLNRMKIYSRMMTEFLYKESKYNAHINVDYINDIERFSPLHDIGKVAIRDEILLKPGKLSSEEFQIMKLHTVYGGQVLRAAEENLEKSGRGVFKLGIEIAEGHHEKWDGSGYPFGKKGEEIPLSARIVALADVFDALTSKRPYKEPFPVEQSFQMIEQNSGAHFDPEIVRVFLNNKHEFVNKYEAFKSS